MTYKQRLIKKLAERLVGVYENCPFECNIYLDWGGEYSNRWLIGLWLDGNDNVIAKIDWAGCTCNEPIEIIPTRVIKDILVCMDEYNKK